MNRICVLSFKHDYKHEEESIVIKILRNSSEMKI